MYRTNTLQKTPTVLFLHSALFFGAVENKKGLVQTPSFRQGHQWGTNLLHLCHLYQGFISQHLPAMEIMVTAGGTQIPLGVWVVVDHDQGCCWVAMPCWTSESHDGRSCHAVPGHLTQREGEMTQVGLSFKYCSSLRLTCKTHWRVSSSAKHIQPSGTLVDILVCKGDCEDLHPNMLQASQC